MEQDNTRQEQLKDNIENTDEDISKIQIVIQQLDNLIFSIKDVDVRSDLLLLVDKYENQIKFLEELKLSDEKTLNLFC